MGDRIPMLLAAAGCLVGACTARNPDYRSFPAEAGALSDGGRDLAGLDLTARDLSLLPGDVAEDVLATWEVGESENDTIVPCNPVARGHVALAKETMRVREGAEAVRVSYDGVSYFQAATPKSRNAGWDLTGRSGLSFFLDAQQGPNYGGWDPAGPTVVLCGQNGSYRRLQTQMNRLPRAPAGYVEIKIPLVGGAGWNAADVGGFSLARVNSVEFHADPLKGAGTGNATLWLDGVRFY
ncbi:MAG: hypothetical protein EXR72_13765 [Myxococcales bacterium]|nr:hypothetical protein [Myxococcales bacterium]